MSGARVVYLCVIIWLTVPSVRSANIPLRMRSNTTSSHLTGELSESSSTRFSFQYYPSHLDSSYIPNVSSYTDPRHTEPTPTSMVTRTRSQYEVSSGSLPSTRAPLSSRTHASAPSPGGTQTSTISVVSSWVDISSHKSTETSVGTSTTGLPNSSTDPVLVSGTSTSDISSSSSDTSSDSATSHEVFPTTVTDTSSLTDEVPVPLTTYSSRSVTSVTIVTGVTSNSHTSTVGSDHHTNLIPIVGGSLCWFCPPAIDAGIGLSGMGLPGVYPPGPPPPGFPSSLPAITVDSVGEPTYSSTETNTKSTDSSGSSSSTSSSSCAITETASSCTVITSYGVDTTQSTTTTFTTTSCIAVSGCTAEGTTQTSVTTSTATAGCYRFPDDSTSAKKRNVDEGNADPVAMSLWRRGRDKGFFKFGSCDLGIQSNRLFYPTHPGPSKIVDFMNQRGTPLKGLYIVPDQKCGVSPRVTLHSDIDTLTSQAYYDEDKKKYVAMGVNEFPFVQTEHVYELQTMPAFLTYLIDKNLISCQDMKNAFFPGDDTNLGQKLFDQLPSFTYPDFVVLDNNVNDWKGKIFNGDLKGGRNTAAKLKEIYNVTMAFDYMRIDDVYTKFQSTNARIYEFLRDEFDSCGSQNAPQGGWAPPAYSTFMSAYLSSKGTHAATQMSNRWKAANGDKRNGPAETAALSLLTEAYPSASWTFDIDTLLSWPAAAIRKRTACALSSSDKSTASSTQAPQSEQTTVESSKSSTASSTPPTSGPATPRSRITSQSSPTQTQDPADPFGTGEITATSTLEIVIPTSGGYYYYTKIGNFAPLPSNVEISTLSPATWRSTNCFVWPWTEATLGSSTCACVTWQATDIMEGNSANIVQVTEFEHAFYATGCEATSTV